MNKARNLTSPPATPRKDWDGQRKAHAFFKTQAFSFHPIPVEFPRFAGEIPEAA